MTPEAWHKVRDIFAEAADLHGDERQAYLATACAPDSAERAEVERLLAAHDAPDELPETVALLPWSLGERAGELSPHTLVSERYRIIERVGHGGMGEVYEADDLELGGRVALKTMLPEFRENAEALARFRKEASLSRRLAHPNLCRVFDAGIHTTPDGREVIYLTMELLTGQTLTERLSDGGPLGVERAAPLISQVLAGLSALHDADVIHRDLKPGNIMLVEKGRAERVALMDFGLARALSEAAPGGARTATGRILGTPDYMAPEQLVGKPAGPATDLFSFGVVVYELLTGEKPWPGEDRWNAEPVPLRQRRRELPQVWETALERCLRRDPTERPQSVTELAGLLGVRPAGASSAERPPLQPSPPPWRRWLPWAAVICFALLALLGWELRERWQGPETASPEAVEGEWRIALLPFESIGDDEALAGSAAGLGDVIARRLSQFNSPSGTLMVASPREVRGRGIESPSQAAAQLQARMVVEGNLLANGDEVELTLAVVDTETGETVKSATVADASDNLVGLQRQAVARLQNLLSLRLRPDNAEAPLDLAPGAYEFYVQGLGYLERDDQLEQVEYAEGLFRKALEADPDFADAQAGLAAALWQKFKRTSNPDWIAEAVKEAEKALQLDPDSDRAHVTLGLAKNRRPETQEEALEHFNRVLAADPNHGEALEGLADTYRRMGRTEEAEAAFRDMLARRRGDWRAYKYAALFYESQGRYDESIEALQAALELTPDNAEILGTLGTVHMLDGDFLEAKTSYERSVAIEPTQASLANLGSIYHRTGDLENAILTLEKAASMESARHQTWSMLARAYGAAGREADKARAAEKAVQLAQRALDADPANVSAMLGLGAAFTQTGQSEMAADLAERAVGLQPAAPRTVAAAATIIAEAGRMERAHALACKAIELGVQPNVFETSADVQVAMQSIGPCNLNH